jgi:hypothetical protein
LFACVHGADESMDLVSIREQALAVGWFEDQPLGLLGLELPARLGGGEHANQPLLDPVLAGDPSGDRFFRGGGEANVRDRPASAPGKDFRG